VLEVAGAVLLVALAWSYALRTELVGTFVPYAIVAVPFAVMTAIYAVRAARAGMLAERLRPRSGDFAFGFTTAALVYAAALVGRALLVRSGSARSGWLVQIYLHFGEPSFISAHILLVTLLVVIVAMLEEIAWRGYVLSVLASRIGPRAAWPVTAVLQAVSYVATVTMLRYPFAGPNPLVVFAVLGSGLLWGFVVARTQRLPVAVISHAMFSWAALVQFPL
jgi:membrane protease YdiL (CAAX protease family)